MEGESRWKIVLSDGKNIERTYYEWGKNFAEAYNKAISQWVEEQGCAYYHVYNRKMEDCYE